jgi:Leucine-rich repeat (LRR) protein
LILDGNKIRKIKGVRALRKLEKLSLSGNIIKDLVQADSTEPMLELKELLVQKNKLKCI